MGCEKIDLVFPSISTTNYKHRSGTLTVIELNRDYSAKQIIWIFLSRLECLYL